MRRSEMVRADTLLVDRGLAPSRSKARALILAGEVRVGADRVITKAGEMLAPNADLRIDERPRFVSRGGEKLQHALEVFDVDPKGVVAADFGASTGGFTDCLLQHGAAKVYAIDVGYGQLDYRLRADSRVVVMERTNVRYLEELPESIGLIVVDVSFISLRLMLGPARTNLATDGDLVTLIKPQFEAGKEAVNRRGVVTKDADRKRVIRDVVSAATDHAFGLVGITESPVIGPAGNVEYLAHFRRQGSVINLDRALDDLFPPGS